MGEPSKTTILIVDDDDCVLKALGRALRLEHEILMAKNHADAMRILSHTRCHTLITDRNLGDEDGIALAVSAMSWDGTMNIVLMSGQDINIHTRDFLKNAEITFLPKPVDMKKLQEVLNRSEDFVN